MIWALRVGAIAKPDVERWVTRMVAAGTGPRTIQARVKMLGQVMRDAVDLEVARRDPTKGVKVPALSDRPDRLLSPGRGSAPARRRRALEPE